MKKYIFILIGIAIIIVASGAWLAFQREAVIIPVEKVVKQDVVLVIDNGTDPAQTFQIKFQEQMTAFTALKNKAEETGLNLKTKMYDIGVFVEAIGDKEGGQDGKYWMYYVNGQAPMVAADKQVLKPGDKVEFKFEKSPY